MSNFRPAEIFVNHSLAAISEHIGKYKKIQMGSRAVYPFGLSRDSFREAPRR